jgi:hypothetical protein
MIGKETATDIAMAYREVETAEKLLAEIRDTISRREAPDIRDAFGRRQDGLTLGVPSGNNGHRLFNVPFPLAAPIIEAHIAQQRAVIAALSHRAASEAASGTLTEGGDVKQAPGEAPQSGGAKQRNVQEPSQ